MMENFVDLLHDCDMQEMTPPEHAGRPATRDPKCCNPTNDSYGDDSGREEPSRHSSFDYRLAVMSNSASDREPVANERDDKMRNMPLSPNFKQECSTSNVKAKIEAVFEGFANSLLHDQPQLSLNVKRKAIKRRASSDILKSNMMSTRISFPGKTAEEAWRFTVIVRILELIYEALRDNVIMSKRDIYYRDPALFGSQLHVDRYIEDIALTFDVSRAALNVTAASKGLVAGAVKICRRDGSTLSLALDREGTLVPTLDDVLAVDMSLVRWIIVIEKEATFRSIAASELWSSISANGIIITSKGYPDVATRTFLRFVSVAAVHNCFAAPAVYGLVDFDPDGLGIFSNYKYGATNGTVQNADLCLPQLQWLGLQCEQISWVMENSPVTQSLQPLTQRDRKRAVNMLQYDKLANEAPVRQDIQRMLLLNVKGELQLLDETDGGTCAFLQKLVAEVPSVSDYRP